MGLPRKVKKHLSMFSFKVFVILVLCLVIPMYGMFQFVRSQYERHIQEELSNKIIQGISKSEQEIYKAFQSMANISSILALDSRVVSLLENDSADLYDRMVPFDAAVGNIEVNNLFTISDVRITLLDLRGNVFSNWELNYHDYSFLKEEEWLKESVRQKGHIIWNMFSPGIQIRPGEPKKDEDKDICLARAVLSDGVIGDHIGTLMVSISQNDLGELLNQFSYDPDDSSYICIPDGEILLKRETVNVIPQEHIAGQMQSVEGKDRGSLRDRVNGKEYLVSYYTISQPWTFNGQRLKVLHYTDYRSVAGQMQLLSGQMNLAMLLFVIILVMLVGFISSRIVRPVRVLSDKMSAYTIEGELTNLELRRHDEIGHLNRAFLRMSNRIRELFDKLNHEHEVREKYQFEALRAQVNPHFLFNTLAMIRWMAIARKADNIVESIDALADMLKYSMSRGGELVSLKEELDNIRRYVFIQNCRFGDRYQVKIQVDEDLLAFQVIKFILQPVVENALIHGFEKENGIIWIYGEQERDTLKIYVEDNGKGIAQDILDDFNEGGETHRDEKKLTGIGLTNINERIQVAYGQKYGIKINSTLGEGTTVIYTLPILKEGQDIEKNHGG